MDKTREMLFLDATKKINLLRMIVDQFNAVKMKLTDEELADLVLALDLVDSAKVRQILFIESLPRFDFKHMEELVNHYRNKLDNLEKRLKKASKKYVK